MAALLACVLLALLVLDWLQTVQIAIHPERWYERNPLLGKHPTVGRVCLHFCVACWLVVIGWAFLPANWSVWVFGVCIAAEVVCVVNNWRLGIRLPGLE